MATLTVLKFNTPDGAEQTATVMQELQKQGLVTIRDAAIVSFPPGAKKPKTRQLHSMAGLGALDGAFWGMLFGLIFFIPLLGLALGAAAGALAGSFVDVGIDDNFIKEVRAKVTPGTSALFLLTENAVMDRVADEIKKRGIHFELIASNLSREQEDKLRERFAA
jgi:uncharacterized membrane protein